MDLIDELLGLQAGVIARRQALTRGLTAGDVRRLLRRREWVQLHPGVYVDHTGEPTWLQRAWAAVLVAWPAALSHDSAMRAAEGPGRRDRDEQVLHVAVHRHRHLADPTGARLHRTSDLDGRVQWNTGPPRIRYDDAALDVAIEARSELDAIAVLAGAVQSRRSTAARMRASLERRPRVARRRWLTDVLADVESGTCSVLEHGYLTRVERPHGLPTPWRQRRAAGTTGRVYRDAEYDGRLVVELDGRLFHDTARSRDADLDRDLDAAVDGRQTVRLSWGQVFDRGCVTAARLDVLLQKRGWDSRAVPCGPGCAVGP